MYECVKAGRIIFEESKPTISDGTSGGVEEQSVSTVVVIIIIIIITK